MALPNISVTRTPAGVVNPGQQISFTVTATDADARTVVYTFKGTDLGLGEKSVTESVTVSDPVTVSATVADPAGVASTPVKDAVNPNLWKSTV